jgi:hypothetical protein
MRIFAASWLAGGNVIVTGESKSLSDLDYRLNCGVLPTVVAFNSTGSYTYQILLSLGTHRAVRNAERFSGSSPTYPKLMNLHHLSRGFEDLLL